jgi:hypothetical protein
MVIRGSGNDAEGPWRAGWAIPEDGPMLERLLLAWILASVPATAFIVLALRAGARHALHRPELVPVRVTTGPVVVHGARRAG